MRVWVVNLLVGRKVGGEPVVGEGVLLPLPEANEQERPDRDEHACARKPHTQTSISFIFSGVEYCAIFVVLHRTPNKTSFLIVLSMVFYFAFFQCFPLCPHSDFISYCVTYARIMLVHAGH